MKDLAVNLKEIFFVHSEKIVEDKNEEGWKSEQGDRIKRTNLKHKNDNLQSFL